MMPLHPRQAGTVFTRIARKHCARPDKGIGGIIPPTGRGAEPRYILFCYSWLASQASSSAMAASTASCTASSTFMRPSFPSKSEGAKERVVLSSS